MNTQPTVFVVDDDDAVRDALHNLFESFGYQVETFGDASCFLDSYDPARPGCLLLDVRMPGMDGMQLQRNLAKRHPHLPVIFLTAHADVPMAVDAMRDGAVDFVEKPYDKDRLLQCIRNAIERDAEHRRTQEENADINERLGTLTQREREVLGLLVDGKTPVQIATMLGTSRNTVGNQRASILEKMAADSVVDLVNMLTRVEGLRQTPDAE